MSESLHSYFRFKGSIVRVIKIKGVIKSGDFLRYMGAGEMCPT